MARPTKITKEVVAKLEEALKLDMPIEKACKYAGIHKANFYRRAEKDKEFRDQMKRAGYFATKIARHSVIKHMKSDGGLALKYLERKASDEFSTSHKVVQTNLDIELSKQEQKAVKESLKEVGLFEKEPKPESDEQS